MERLKNVHDATGEVRNILLLILGDIWPFGGFVEFCDKIESWSCEPVRSDKIICKH